MPTSAEIRLLNLNNLLTKFQNERPELPNHGILTKFAEFTNQSPRYLSHIWNGRKNVGAALARKIESAFQLTEGWMDVEHGIRATAVTSNIYGSCGDSSAGTKILGVKVADGKTKHKKVGFKTVSGKTVSGKPVPTRPTTGSPILERTVVGISNTDTLEKQFLDIALLAFRADSEQAQIAMMEVLRRKLDL